MAARRRWAAGVAALALAASGGVAAVALRGDDRAAPSSARAYPTVPARGAPREPSAIPPAGRSQSERAALEAARRFLAGYLPYSYGHAPASRIRDAAAPLAQTLRRRPARVAAGEREREPQLVALEVASVNGELGFDLAATIDDGRRRYAMT